MSGSRGRQGFGGTWYLEKSSGLGRTWKRILTLSLSFLICKMEALRIPMSQDSCENSLGQFMKSART